MFLVIRKYSRRPLPGSWEGRSQPASPLALDLTKANRGICGKIDTHAEAACRRVRVQVCWLTGRKISDALAAAGDASPVGLIESCWGGTTVQLWSPAKALAACNGTEGGNKQPGLRANHTNPHWNGDGGLYNAMIAPFKTVRFAGAVWYQGEVILAHLSNRRFLAHLTIVPKKSRLGLCSAHS